LFGHESHVVQLVFSSQYGFDNNLGDLLSGGDGNNNSDPEMEDNHVVRGLSGLVNLGNTCFMNSILQCLSASDLFRSYLLRGNFMKQLVENQKKILAKNTPEISMSDLELAVKNTITYRLRELFTLMWNDLRPYSPKSFKTVLGKYKPKYAGFRQQDSHELLALIIDIANDELKTDCKVTINNLSSGIRELIRVRDTFREIVDNESATVEEKKNANLEFKKYKKDCKEHVIEYNYHKFWKTFVKNNYSIIRDLFTGIFISEIVCDQCQNFSVKFEAFTTLSLEICRNKGTLEECLKHFSQTERLDSANKWKCDLCKKKVNAWKTIYIWKPPPILIIQLKRFRNSFMIEKDSTLVKFPLENLTLEHNYYPDHYLDSSYDLYSTSNHNGGYGGGHYISYCQNSINNKWYEFNDASVYYIPDSEVLNTVVTQNAYTLFYVNRKYKRTGYQ